MKKFGKIIGGIILGIVLILLAAVAILTALEYRPDQIEPDLAKTKISLWTAEVKSCRRRKIW